MTFGQQTKHRLEDNGVTQSTDPWIVDGQSLSTATAIVTSNSSDTEIIAAPGSGKKLLIYKIVTSPCITGTPTTENSPYCNGPKFRFESGSFFADHRWQAVGKSSGGGVTLLSMNPFLIDLSPDYWEGGDNEAFNGRLISASTLSFAVTVSVFYREADA